MQNFFHWFGFGFRSLFRWLPKWLLYPFLGTNLHPKDRSPSQFYYISIRGSECESEPVEKFCIVQESMSVSESESVFSSGNKPLQSHLSSAFSFARLWLMAHLHCRRRTRIPNLMATLYYGGTCSHCTDSDSDPYSLCLHRTGIWVCIHIRVRFRQYKRTITVKTFESEGNRETEKNYCFFR